MSEEESKNNHDEKPATRGKRFLKLAGMTAYVAGNMAKSKIRSVFRSEEELEADRQERNRQNGQRIAETLGQLKGAVMKVGQMASMASDLFPKEVIDAMKSLQNEAPPVSFDVIVQQIESELGAHPSQLFASFDEEPFASASIGQVHRAVTDDGREVVVKVQYPGVDESCDSDLAHLKLALRASGLLKVDRKALDALFQELKTRLHEELDYCNEADNVRLFRDFHAKHPFVVVPDVVGERSSQRVLTLTYEPGDSIHQLDEKAYPQEVRNQLGAHLYEMTIRQICELQSIHGDPNPANLAFREDGSIVLYDFGCVKKLKLPILEAYCQTILAAMDENYDAVEEGLLAIGVRNPKGAPVEADYYRGWREIILRPFTQKDTPFDYGTATLHHEVVKRIPTIVKRMDSFQPAVETLFIDRVAAGHYENLRKIKARGHFYSIIEPYIRALLAEAESVQESGGTL